MASHYVLRCGACRIASFVSAPADEPRRRRRWRDYRTVGGRRPVRDFIDKLTDADAAEVLAAMHEVAVAGLTAARHLRGDIYEVRAWGVSQTFRILFAEEGRRGQVLLALDAFSKKSQKTPPDKIGLAEKRLRDWRTRGAERANSPPYR